MDQLRFAFLTLVVVGFAALIGLRGSGDAGSSVALAPPPVQPEPVQPQPTVTAADAAPEPDPEPTAEPTPEPAPTATPEPPPTAEPTAEPAPTATPEPPPATETAAATEAVPVEERPPLYAAVATQLATVDFPGGRVGDRPARLIIATTETDRVEGTSEIPLEQRGELLELLDVPARFDPDPVPTQGDGCREDQGIVRLEVPHLDEGGADAVATVQGDCGGFRTVRYTFAPVLGQDELGMVNAEVVEEG